MKGDLHVRHKKKKRRDMKRLIAIAGIILISAALASAKDLKTYKATYEKEMGILILSHGMKMAELGQQYTKALDVLLNKVKKAGDLDKTTAVMEEIARFRNEKEMPKKPSALLNIQNWQSSFAKQASSHESDKARKIISLTSKYDLALGRLQKSLVSSSMLDEAKAVQEERKGVKEREPYTSASRYVTELAAKATPRTPRTSSSSRNKTELAAKVTPRNKTEKYRVTVSAMNNDKDPCMTEIVLKKGDTIKITPNSRDKWGGGGSRAGSLCSYKGYGKSKRYWMAMQYEIGTMRDYVKSNRMITVKQDGELMLFCYDGDTTGNVGKIETEVSVTRK